jgi:GH24 family phage-related lysozyme (muramidase)
MITTVSPAGLAFLSGYEGTVLHVYCNAGDVPTVGRGHVIRAGEVYPCSGPPWPTAAQAMTGELGHDARCPGLTQERIDAIFAADVDKIAAVAVTGLSRSCAVVFTQNMFDALASLSFNTGPAAVTPADSHVARCLQASDTIGAARHFLDWIRTPGWEARLLARRWQEVAVFLTLDGQPVMSLETASRLIGVALPSS